MHLNASLIQPVCNQSVRRVKIGLSCLPGSAFVDCWMIHMAVIRVLESQLFRRRFHSAHGGKVVRIFGSVSSRTLFPH